MQHSGRKTQLYVTMCGKNQPLRNTTIMSFCKVVESKQALIIFLFTIKKRKNNHT